MASKSCWKAAESEIAFWFDTSRNPLSGRNNRNDDGSKRLGDALYLPAVVEVKVRKGNAIISRALETRALAESKGKPWIHLERLLGDRSVTVLALPTPLAERVVRFLRAASWEHPQGHKTLPARIAGEGRSLGLLASIKARAKRKPSSTSDAP